MLHFKKVKRYYVINIIYMIKFIFVNILSFLIAILLYYIYYKKYLNNIIIPNIFNINDFIYIDDNNIKYKYYIKFL
jgi:hypothetical protein